MLRLLILVDVLGCNADIELGYLGSWEFINDVDGEVNLFI